MFVYVLVSVIERNGSHGLVESSAFQAGTQFVEGDKAKTLSYPIQLALQHALADKHRRDRVSAVLRESLYHPVVSDYQRHATGPAQRAYPAINPRPFQGPGNSCLHETSHCYSCWIQFSCCHSCPMVLGVESTC